MLADARLGDGAADHAGGLAVVVVEAPLLAAARSRGVAAAGVQQAAGLAVAGGGGPRYGDLGGRGAGRETQPRVEKRGAGEDADVVVFKCLIPVYLTL